jgi:carbamoyltransferase
MQYAVKCLRSDLVPAIVHKDGTSRVQTVNKDQHIGLWRVLNKFYQATGVPMLLNTSLNIKGQPLLNDSNDILLWEQTYNTKIIKGTNNE